MTLENSTSTNAGNQVPDIFEALRALKRNSGLLIKLMAVFMLAGFLAVSQIPSKYRAYATLVLNEETLNINNISGKTTGTRQDNMSVKTEAKILGSASLAEQTIETVKLTEHPEYSWAKDSAAAVNAFASNLTIYTQNTSRAIEVAFTSKDPKLAAAVANAHAAGYLQAKIAFKKEQTQKLREWFKEKTLQAEQQADGMNIFEPSSIETPPEMLGDVLSSPLIQQLKIQAATLSQDLSAVRAKYGPRHPEVLEVESQLLQVTQAIDTEIETIVGSTMQDNMVWPDATLVSAAIVPTKPIAPGKTMMMFLVAVFAACLSLGLVFMLELSRSGPRNFEDIRRLSQKPLGILPLTKNPLQAVKNDLQNSYKEAIKRIYMAGFMNDEARSVLITSAMPKEGRTSFTIALAHYIRSLGHSVVVVDADFVRPALSHLTGIPAGEGLADVLIGEKQLHQVLDTQDNGVAVLRAGTKDAYSPDIMKSGRLKVLLDTLKGSYTYVLVDAGPMLAHSESHAIASQVDGLVVLTEWLKTSTKNLTNVFTSVQTLQTPVLGVVMNKVDIDKYKALSSGSDFLLPKATNAA